MATNKISPRATKKISQLDSAESLSGSELVPIVQGQTTRKATMEQIGQKAIERVRPELDEVISRFEDEIPAAKENADRAEGFAEDASESALTALLAKEYAESAASDASSSASLADASATLAEASANLAEQARLLGATIGFSTKADMDSSLAHPEGTLALVTNDATEANNGTYRKTGASGSGAWVKSADRVTGLEGRVAAVEPALASSIGNALGLRNLWTDNDFSGYTNFALYPGGGTVSRELYGGRWALRIGPGNKARIIQRAAIGADTVSATITVLAKNTPTGGGRILFQQFGEGGELSALRQTVSLTAGVSGSPQVVKFEGVALDPTTTFIRILMDGGLPADNYIIVSDASVVPGSLAANVAPDPPAQPTPYTIVYVNGQSGSDTAAGSKAAPLQTVNAAIAKLNGNGTVMVQAGDIAPFSLAGCKNVRIVSEVDAIVRVMSGTLVTGPITKTAGRVKVYQATIGSMANLSTGQWIFEHGVPELPIPANERHSLHRGRTHRLPSTRIRKVNSIAEIDAASGPSWFYASGILYFSIASGGDATGSTIYIPSTSKCVGGATGGECVEIIGIEAWYGDSGFDMTNCASYRLVDCRSVGARIQGFKRDGGHGVEIRCESAASGNDGFNTHNTLAAPNARESYGLFIDQWSHDNGDDGCSEHERCVATYIGGLNEYNGDRGMATAVGASVTAYSMRSRKNGQSSSSSGEGFGAVGQPVSANDSGVSTDMVCIECVAEGDKIGFAATGNNCTMRAQSCRTINCTTGYTSRNAGSNVELIDCGDVGSTTIKNAVGPMAIFNTTPVT